MVRATILVGYMGGAGDGLRQAVDTLCGERTGEVVEAASLRGHPSFEDALRSCIEKGAAQIVVVPYLLHLEDEVRRELSERAEAVEKAHPNLQCLIAPPIGFDRRLVDIVQDRMEQVEQDASADVPILKIEGRVAAQADLSYRDFQRLPDQIPDIGRIVPKRQGTGVWVRTLLTAVKPGATHAVFHATEDGFSARVSLADVSEKGFLIYQINGQPLPASLGGPLRLLIPGLDDRCANVKGVVRLEITAG